MLGRLFRQEGYLVIQGSDDGPRWSFYGTKADADAAVRDLLPKDPLPQQPVYVIAASQFTRLADTE